MSNLRNAGRTSLVITLNFNRVDDTVNEILSLCSNEMADILHGVADILHCTATFCVVWPTFCAVRQHFVWCG